MLPVQRVGVGGVDRAYVLWSLVHAVFDHINGAQTSVQCSVKFGKGVLRLLTIFSILCPNIDIFSQVCIKFIIIDILDSSWLYT